MLGAQERRTYLLMFQNNAEVRATGGIPGAFAVVTARDGAVHLGRQESTSTLGRFATPVLTLSAAEKSLFGTRLGTFTQDVNLTPDFPRTAALLQAMWTARTGVKVDGVLSADPVALSYVLRGTGPVAVSAGRSLSADDAVRALLSRVYSDTPDPAAQDAYFATVAKRVFGAVTSAQGNPRNVLEMLTHAAEQRRVLVWSDHADEQALIAPTRLGGVLPTAPTRTPQIGVYFNDGSQSKLDYYLDYGVDVRSTGCRAGRQEMTVTVRMRSRVPRDVSALPDYVQASGRGVSRGTMRTTVMVYVPVRGQVGLSTLRGEPVLLATRTHEGRAMVAQTIDLAPGQRATSTYRMTSGPGQTGQAEVQVTPGVRNDGIGSVTRSACRR
jgi:hypothetical protein